MNDDKGWLSIWWGRAKKSFRILVIAGIGFLIGLYIVAPQFAEAEKGYIPPSVLKMPVRTVQFETTAGMTTLPVRLADTYRTREQGLRYVGPEALETTFLLYDQDEVTSYSIDYETKGIREPLSMAVINGDGKVMKIETATTDQDSVNVQLEHRWVLAVEQGMLDNLGIQKGSRLIPDSIQKL